ncbi:MAG: hypothetical protein JOZ38_01135 [Candidatus Eremiobacteraeota bacterium]|nr:hypothetical protein [Candidatus Eremiobacteraeota bacterium]
MTAAAFLCAIVALAPVPASTQTAASTTTRDGHRDFDFLLGSWHTHYRLLRHRLANDRVWKDCYGTSVVSTFWQGSGELEDGDLRCSDRYIAGMTLRLYDAATHQWSLYWGTKKLGLVPPPQVGHFDSNGVGEFYAPDKYEGRPIIVRYRWSLRPGNHPRFEQAFSADNGKTWETNWTTDYTRIQGAAAP